MLIQQNYYSPVDVAMHWCHQTQHQQEILQIAFEQPQKLLSGCSRWPLLPLYLERVCDAIDSHELQAWYLGQPLMIPVRACLYASQVRRCDLRFWILRCFPDEKPDFIFLPANDHSHCIALGTHLAQSAELAAAIKEIDKSHQESLRWQQQCEAVERRYDALLKRGAVLTMPGERSLYTLSVVLGAVLVVCVGKAPSGQWQSVYKKQVDLVKEILRYFPGIAGLTKRTLDRKFSESRRLLIQEK